MKLADPHEQHWVLVGRTEAAREAAVETVVRPSTRMFLRERLKR